MEKKRFLFLGNSHTYFNDMPELFRRMCRESEVCDVELTMLARPYAIYGDHLKEETPLRFAMIYGGYDYLIMQQAAHSPCPSEEDTLRDGSEIVRLAKARGIVPLQILPWAEKAKPERQAELNRAYRRFAEENGVKLIPAGLVFDRARSRSDIPDLYWQDGEHASPWGSYAIAATLCATLFQCSPVGFSPLSLAFDKISDVRGQEDWKPAPYPLDPVVCTALQAFIWTCVKEEL